MAIASTRVNEVRSKIRAELDPSDGTELVTRYYTSGKYAGALFDEFGHNPRDTFTSDDLLATGLLSVPFGPRAVRGILLDADRLAAVGGHLRQIPTDVPLWSEIHVGPGSPAASLWSVLREVKSVGRVRTSKLLARKRPHLLPILDSVIRQYLALDREDDAWQVLQLALRDDDLRGRIDDLRREVVSHQPSTLRCLDVLVWMRHVRDE